VVETIRLESGHTLTGIGGSNPSLSAITFVIGYLQAGDTYTDSELNLRCLTESCTKIYLKDIERTDLLKFCAFLRAKKNQAPRTVYNKFENVMTFLKANGIRGLAGKNDRPRYTEEEPEMYEQTELDKLFKACDAEERLWYEFFLMTGMREQEVIYTYRSDVNFAASTVRGQPQVRSWMVAEGLQGT
jgi:integrase